MNQTAVDEALALVRTGLSANKAAAQIAPEYGIAPRTLHTWAQKAGTPLGDASHAGAKNARSVAKAQHDAKRAQLMVRLLVEIEYLFDRIHEPHYDYRGKDNGRVDFEAAPDGAVRNYVVSAAVLIDKLRLEEGKTTARSESISVDAAEKRIREWIAEAEEHANAE